MEFEIPPDSSEKPDPSSSSTQRTHLDFRIGNRSSQTRKLAMLVLMLIGVIYAMVEMGKPERWYWLIPPNNPEAKPIQIQPLNSGSESESENFGSGLESGSRAIGQAQPDSAQPLQKPDAAEVKSNRPVQTRLTQPNSEDYPESAQRFWASMIRQMSEDQRRSLFVLLKRIRHGQELDRDHRESLEALIAAIRKARSKFQEDLMNKIAYSAEGPQKAKLANDHFESESTWDRSEWPAISAFLAGESLSQDQKRSLRLLQSVLDPLILEFVEDRTAQGWEGDSPAWGRMWERLMFEELPAPTPVTHLELSAQSRTHRNRSISIRGWVRGGWREDLPIPELGIKYLYVLVVQPEDSKVSPCFLYARELPEGFPSIQKKYQTLNHRIGCQGLFFKIRTYLDTEKKVQTGPMILVDSIQLIASSIGFSEGAAIPGFKPAWLIAGLVLLLLIAGGVAWFAFQTTKTRRFQPGPNRTREIHQSLGSLANDPGIKTDLEKVRELYE